MKIKGRIFSIKGGITILKNMLKKNKIKTRKCNCEQKCETCDGVQPVDDVML